MSATVRARLVLIGIVASSTMCLMSFCQTTADRSTRRSSTSIPRNAESSESVRRQVVDHI